MEPSEIDSFLAEVVTQADAPQPTKIEPEPPPPPKIREKVEVPAIVVWSSFDQGKPASEADKNEAARAALKELNSGGKYAVVVTGGSVILGIRRMDGSVVVYDCLAKARFELK